MNLKDIKKYALRIAFAVKKKSPKIKLIAGLSANAAGSILAVKKSLDPYTREILDIYECEKEDDKHTALKNLIKGLIKQYGLAVVLYVIGDILIVNSHAELTERNNTLAASNMMLAGALASSRTMELKKHEENEDGTVTDISYTAEEIAGINSEIFDALSPEDRKKFIRDAARCSDIGISPYAFFFDETNPNWTGVPEADLTFCLAKERECEDYYKEHGHIVNANVKHIYGENRVSKVDFVAGLVEKDGTHEMSFVDLGINRSYAETNNALKLAYEGANNVILINPQNFCPNILLDSDIPVSSSC